MTDHAALGFDPAPGNPVAVLALTRKLSASATSLGEASRVVKALVSHSSAWEGEAATAYPAIARRAKKGEFVKCFDHFDLLQTAIN